jgi:protein-tyrosine phosphatase
MVDIHCHILPQVDDGPKSWETSLAMCRIAIADGIRHIVATPHANDRYDYDRERYIRLLAHLRDKLGGEALNFSLGCDFHLSYENIQDAFAHPERYVIDGTRYLLVEFSDYSIPPQTSEYFFQFMQLRITPILTHPERNPVLRSDLKRVLDWVEKGCLVQVTASALKGFWGESVRKAAQWLFEHQAVHVVASDGHDPERRRPELSAARDAIAAAYGSEVAEMMVEHNPAAIVAGRPVTQLPAPAKPRRRWTWGGGA